MQMNNLETPSKIDLQEENEAKLVKEMEATNEDECEDSGFKNTSRVSIKSDIDNNVENKYIKNIVNFMDSENVDKNKTKEDIHVMDKQEHTNQHLENDNSIEDEDTETKSMDKNIIKQNMTKRRNEQPTLNSLKKENGFKQEHDDEINADIKPEHEIDNDHIYDAYEDDNNKIIKKYHLRKGKSKIMKIEDPEEKINPNNLRRFKRWFVDDEFVYPLKCDKCSKTFNSKTGLLNHMRMHQTEQKFTCMLCQEEYRTNGELKDHKKVHDDENLSFTCAPCQKAFSSHLDYLLHDLKHRHCLSYRCKECRKTYKKGSFEIHIRTHFHTQYVCEICHKTFKTERIYRNHSKFHINPTFVECQECGKQCKDKKGLDYHMVSHTGVKRHQCLYCGKGFANKFTLNTHTRIHTNERPYECKICYDKFKQSGDLKKHLETHDTVKKFQCEFCDKKFRHKQGLIQHTRSHTLEKVYPCLECNKTFTLYANLRSHTLHMHTSEKPHKCEVCKLQFTMKHDLTRHFRSLRHRNMMYGQKKQ